MSAKANPAGNIGVFVMSVFAIGGCSAFAPTVQDSSNPPPDLALPKTAGEQYSGYGYIPLDGLAVQPTLDDESCKNWRPPASRQTRYLSPEDIVGARAGEDPVSRTARVFARYIGEICGRSFDGSGGLAFGPAKVTAKGQNYRAILDYVNVDVIPVTFEISVFKEGGQRIPMSEASRSTGLLYVAKIVDEELRPISTPSAAVAPGSEQETPFVAPGDIVTIPVYVGIGMRLTAEIRALEADVPLISLGVIGLEAQAKRLTGTLTVQTIGISGESVATSLPLPSALDQTTIENGILSIGSNRAVVYRSGSANSKGSGASTVTTPRIVGLYSPYRAEPAFVNAIYAELSRQRPRWARPCRNLPPKGRDS